MPSTNSTTNRAAYCKPATLFFAATLTLASSAVSLAQLSAAQAEGPQPTRILVRADAKGNAPIRLKTSDITMQVDGKPVQLTGLAPLVVTAGLSGKARGQEVEVALLIDDGLRSNFGVQLRDVENFVTSTVGPTTSVGVGYMRNGAAYFSSGFSKDPEVELKAVRLPISASGIDGSPYFCLQELVKHWPTNTGAARVVLMITNGIDRYNGSVSPLNQNSPYVDQAITDAQRANVPVYSIYFGPRGVNSQLGSFSGQGYLGKVAQETGGILFNSGSINPVSLSPYFRQFQQALGNTYLATFLDARPKLESLKVKSNVSGVKVRAQSQVQAGVPQGSTQGQ
jgi:hypothetical protein